MNQQEINIKLGMRSLSIKKVHPFFIKQETETYKKKLLKILIDLKTFISEEM